MFHIFTEVEAEVAKLKTALVGVFSKVSDHVTEAAAWTESELKEAEVAFLAETGGQDFSIAQAFEAGAKWAATKVTEAVKPVIEGVASGVVSGVEAGIEGEPVAAAQPETPAGTVNQ